MTMMTHERKRHLAAILVSSLVLWPRVTRSAAELDFQIRRTLDNDPLPPEERTSFRLSYDCDAGSPTRIVVSGRSPFRDSDVRIYFANSDKAVLEVVLTWLNVVGRAYEHPHGPHREYVGQLVHRHGNDFRAEIPAEWLPPRVSRISASSTLTDGTVHNYYGINNLEISLPDTMVVEEYKKFKFC